MVWDRNNLTDKIKFGASTIDEIHIEDTQRCEICNLQRKFRTVQIGPEEPAWTWFARHADGKCGKVCCFVCKQREEVLRKKTEGTHSKDKQSTSTSSTCSKKYSGAAEFTGSVVQKQGLSGGKSSSSSLSVSTLFTQARDRLNDALDYLLFGDVSEEEF